MSDHGKTSPTGTVREVDVQANVAESRDTAYDRTCLLSDVILVSSSRRNLPNRVVEH